MRNVYVGVSFVEKLMTWADENVDCEGSITTSVAESDNGSVVAEEVFDVDEGESEDCGVASEIELGVAFVDTDLGEGVFDVGDEVFGVGEGVLGDGDTVLGVGNGVFGVGDTVFGVGDGVLGVGDGVLGVGDGVFGVGLGVLKNTFFQHKTTSIFILTYFSICN